MPITPADIHNIAFKKPPIGKRGYDEEQVDAFLDELEQELIRLIEENNDLRTLFARGGAPTDRGADPRLAAALDEMAVQLSQVERDKAAAEQAVRTMQVELAEGRPRRGHVGDGDHEQALPVLAMAGRTADSHVGEARREADGLLSDARTAAQQITSEALAKAASLERDARQRHKEAMDLIHANRATAQQQIEELESFELEYRSRLRAHVESQARDLDGRGRGLKSSDEVEP